MVLHSLNRVPFMSHSHNDIPIRGPRSNLQNIWHSLMRPSQTMISRHCNILSDPFIYPPSIMFDDRGLAMDDFPCKGNCAAESGEDTLLTHTDSEDRDFTGKVEDCSSGYAGVGERMAWTRGDD